MPKEAWFLLSLLTGGSFLSTLFHVLVKDYTVAGISLFGMAILAVVMFNQASPEATTNV